MIIYYVNSGHIVWSFKFSKGFYFLNIHQELTYVYAKRKCKQLDTPSIRSLAT